MLEILENQPGVRVWKDGGAGNEPDPGESQLEAQQGQQEQEAGFHPAGKQQRGYECANIEDSLELPTFDPILLLKAVFFLNKLSLLDSH